MVSILYFSPYRHITIDTHFRCVLHTYVLDYERIDMFCG
jgi:hypothetical protein